FLKAEGITAKESVLTTLRLTANVANHNAGNSADKLCKRRPDLFAAAEMSKMKDKPSYDYLRITDKDLEDFFEAVDSAGPSVKTGWA
ncbi:MAG TPA: hypothetical protein VFE89_06855, partial [Beijerinckiaceae bacterium]|nr:hypothetical protein [Beijerinckiaceae bacterium]